jgi:hypothetical protein
MVTDKRVFASTYWVHLGTILFPLEHCVNRQCSLKRHINEHNCLLRAPKPMYDRITIKCTREIHWPDISLFPFWCYCVLLLGHVGKFGLSVAYDMTNPLSSKRMVLHSLLLACDQLNKHFWNRLAIKTLFTNSLITRYDALVCVFSHAFFQR